MSRKPNYELAESIAKKKEEIFELIALAYYDYSINQIEIKEHIGGVMSPEIIAEKYGDDYRFEIKLQARTVKKGAISGSPIEQVEIVPFNIFKMFYEEVGTVEILIKDYPEVASYLLPLVKIDDIEVDSDVNSDCLEHGFLVEVKDFKPKSLFKKGSYKTILTKKPALLDLERIMTGKLDKYNICFRCVYPVDVVFAEQDEEVSKCAASGKYSYTSVEDYYEFVRKQVIDCQFIKENSKTISDDSSTYKKEEEAINNAKNWQNDQFEAIIFDKKLLG